MNKYSASVGVCTTVTTGMNGAQDIKTVNQRFRVA